MGRLRVPGSKSATHRQLALALLAGGPCTIEHPLEADDTAAFLEVFRGLGWRVEEGAGRVELSPGPERPTGAVFDCRQAGTLLRFLTALLTVVPGRWRVDGEPRLRERPVGPLVQALRQLGARIACPAGEGHAPLEIEGGTLAGGACRLDAGESSQYLSAVLLAALGASCPVRVELAALTSAPYVDLTLELVSSWGGRIERRGDVFEVSPGLVAQRAVRVEGDWSAAAYPAAAAALTGGRVELVGVRRRSAQGDRRFLDLLAAMGAGVDWREDGVVVTGRGELAGIAVDLADLPDQVPTLAALAPFAAGATEISGVPHLRLKESDRLHAMAVELARLGATVEERPAGLRVAGGWRGVATPAGPVVVHSWDDHRIAMSLALVGLRRPGVTVAEPGVVAKSYPGFWEDLESLLGA